MEIPKQQQWDIKRFTPLGNNILKGGDQLIIVNNAYFWSFYEVSDLEQMLTDRINYGSMSRELFKIDDLLCINDKKSFTQVVYT